MARGEGEETEGIAGANGAVRSEKEQEGEINNVKTATWGELICHAFLGEARRNERERKGLHHANISFSTLANDLMQKHTYESG